MTTPQASNESKAGLVAGLVFLAVLVVSGLMPKVPHPAIEVALIALGGGAVLLSYLAVKRGWKIGSLPNLLGGRMQAVSIILGTSIIAATIAVTFRWEVGVAGNHLRKLDRWTGTVTTCPLPREADRNLVTQC
jgi:hypothetical protein